MTSRLSLRQATSYGVGSIATGIFSTAPGLFLVFYLTEYVGISPFLAGIAFFLPRLWDVITDPLVGILSDRTRSRFGRRRPYMAIGALTAPLCFAAVFYGGQSGDTMSSFWAVMIAYALLATFFTVFAIPYIAMPAEFTDDPRERTRVLSFRMGGLVLGILLAGAAGPEVIKAAGGGIDGYRAMGMTLGALMAAAMIICVVGTAGTQNVVRTQSLPGLRTIVAVARSNKQFLILLVGYGLQAIAIGAMLALLPFFSKYILGGSEGTTTILFLCLVLPSLLSMPLWVLIGKRLGKGRSFLTSTLLFLAPTILLLAAGEGTILLATLCVAVSGLGYAGLQLFPFSILADIAANDREQSGEAREGGFTGIWMASEKIAAATGGFAAASILGLFGFVEGAGTSTTLTQSENVLTGIVVGFVVTPSLLLCASLIWVKRLI
ncbi:putative symporter YjmB [Tateyamaria omphalii]|uniref:MFS transporter n=1 Tax=Tateyamaria omphalii TaxID=299262 RepID=UPI00167B2FDB|nr:MFS transporter [Tateyamaria omphalii]GGX42951.1 putative symporter YjmB [Tateyamaria omphalii]